MNEGSIHQLATEIGEALKRLEQLRDHVERLAASVAEVQGEAAGLDSQVRLIAEAGVLRTAQAGVQALGSAHEPGGAQALGSAHEPGAPESGAPAPESGGPSLPAWFAHAWSLVVDRVNQAAAAAEEPDPQATRLTTLQPYLERLAVLLGRLSSEAEPDLAPLTEQFGAVMDQFQTLAVHLAGETAPTLSDLLWDGTFLPPPIDCAAAVTTVERDGRPMPGLDLTAWMAEVEAAANGAIARWYQKRIERREAVRSGAAQANAQWAGLVAALTELENRAGALVADRLESGSTPPDAVREILNSLAEAIRSLDSALAAETESSAQRGN